MTKKRATTKKAGTRPADGDDVIGAGDAADRNDKANRAAAHQTHKPIVQPPNPPPQPAMVPAKQIPGATGSALPADGSEPTRREAKNAIRVQAIDIGYYDDIIRRVGDVFDIYSEKEFSKRWMVRVPAGTPEKVTGSNEALERARKGTTPEVATGDDDVLGAQR